MDAKRRDFASAPRALVTRPEPDGSAFAALLAGAGFRPVLSPVMRIALLGGAPALDGVGAVAFTSANGVRAFRAVLPAALPEAIAALPVFAVGRASGEASREAGFRDIEEAGGDVASLAALIARRYDRPGEVLHVSGAVAAGDLVAALGAEGLKARREILYEAAPVDALSEEALEMLRAPEPGDMAAFFSPRTARLFLDLADAAGVLQGLSRLSAFCLSPAVAEAVRPALWARVAAARKPDASVLLDDMKAAKALARP